MKFNGKEIAIPEGMTLLAFLTAEGFNVSRIAAELNGRIIPKSEYETTRLEEADNLEVVRFVGGG